MSDGPQLQPGVGPQVIWRPQPAWLPQRSFGQKFTTMAFVCGVIVRPLAFASTPTSTNVERTSSRRFVQPFLVKLAVKCILYRPSTRQVPGVSESGIRRLQ